MMNIKITQEELDRHELKKFESTLAAVEKEQHPYEVLQSLLPMVLEEDVDVDEYAPLATEIAYWCAELANVTKGTIFYHPYKQIDPTIYGRAQTFRKECENLQNEIERFQAWR